MTNLIKVPPTHREVILWRRNKNINPRTKRKIKDTGYNYKLLKKTYDRFFPFGYDPLDSIDDKDPITFEIFWIEKNNQKDLIYKDINNLIFYKDKNDMVRCFEKESLEHLKAHKITKHPITGDDIPLDILNSIIDIELSTTRTNKQKALEVFQLFTNISIFIDYNSFIELNDEKLKKFYFETKDFYYKNIDTKNRIKIDNDDGKNIFSKDTEKFNNLSVNKKQEYLLDNLQLLLQVTDDTLKFMINYILVGGLSIVIPQIRKDYPDFCFNFNVDI